MEHFKAALCCREITSVITSLGLMGKPADSWGNHSLKGVFMSKVAQSETIQFFSIQNNDFSLLHKQNQLYS